MPARLVAAVASVMSACRAPLDRRREKLLAWFGYATSGVRAVPFALIFPQLIIRTSL